MIDKLTSELFSQHLNSTFTVDAGEAGPREMALTEVKDRSNSYQELFSILLRCPGKEVLPQMIYSLSHDKMGKFDLFLVPVAQDDTAVYYEAVFNRLRKNGD